jgi:hypothetical protein
MYHACQKKLDVILIELAAGCTLTWFCTEWSP